MRYRLGWVPGGVADNGCPSIHKKIPMSMKKTDLVRQLESKIEGQRARAATPGRFGTVAAAPLDRKEQRKLDAAAGLVAFACKLPAELTADLRTRAAAHAGGMNGLVAELLSSALKA